MAKTKDSINSSIFFALKVSEESGIPVLLLGNPGCGKTTATSMFCELRGYHLVTLRGSTMSETECMGFDCVHNSPTGVEIKHCRPSWFEEILRCEKEGKKVLLFLDEITTSAPLIQAALLNLVFDRKVDAEKLPESTLVVSAGNHINNMTGDFQTLSALWNRFCIFNITANENALDEFLSVYEGASTGSIRNILDSKRDLLNKMDSQAISVAEENIPRIQQYFETAIRETSRALMKSGDKVLDLNCSETQGIYNNQEGDEMMRGFVSLRTLGYLVRNTCSTYFCFGKDGIKSDNYKRIVEGLCGLALSRKNGEVVKSKVADNYYQSVLQCMASIDKLSNSRIKIYEDFFNKIITNTKTDLQKEEVVAILGKIQEMKNDSEIKNVSKPLDDIVVEKLCELIEYNSKKIITFRIKPKENLEDTLTVEKCTGMVTSWNMFSELYQLVFGVISDQSKTYPQSLLKKMSDTKDGLTKDYMRLSSFVKIATQKTPEYKSLIPEIKTLK